MLHASWKPACIGLGIWECWTKVKLHSSSCTRTESGASAALPAGVLLAGRGSTLRIGAAAAASCHSSGIPGVKAPQVACQPQSDIQLQQHQRPNISGLYIKTFVLHPSAISRTKRSWRAMPSELAALPNLSADSQGSFARVST
jgi:hypothetical protein